MGPADGSTKTHHSAKRPQHIVKPRQSSAITERPLRRVRFPPQLKIRKSEVSKRIRCEDFEGKYENFAIKGLDFVPAPNPAVYAPKSPCLVNGNIRNRSLLPGTDTYYGSGERQAFKKRDEKTGKLGSQDGKTNAAVRIIIGHWLDLQHDGYDGHWGAPRPNKWNFHPTVSREYMRLFKLPAHHQVVFDLNAEGKSTAQFLDQSWQKPKETVHRFWQEYGAVSAPGLEFFLQSFGETQA